MKVQLWRFARPQRLTQRRNVSCRAPAHLAGCLTEYPFFLDDNSLTSCAGVNLYPISLPDVTLRVTLLL